MSWNPIDIPCDHILLCGVKSPGLAEVVGLSERAKYDVVRTYAASGATIKYTGDDLAKFAVRIRLYTREDWANWYSWKSYLKIRPRSRGLVDKMDALEIWHPFCEAADINAVVIEDVSQPEQSDPMVFVITIKMIEYR